MRAAMLGFLTLLLGGCASATHNRIVGEAPEDGSCRIDIVDHETANVLHSAQVRGQFSTGLDLEGHWPRRIDIVAVCNGRTVKTKRNLRPTSLGRTNLGSLGP